MSEKLPSREQALNLLYKSGCSRNVIRHCKAVAKLALEIAKRCQERGVDVDIKLVTIGALLHDIGRAKTHSVHHEVAGDEIAKSLNLPNSIRSINEQDLSCFHGHRLVTLFLEGGICGRLWQ